MKKLALLIVIALIGGGAYLYFQEPEKFKEITDTVTDKVGKLIAGSDFQKLKNYEKDFAKSGLTEGEEKEGYVSNLKEQFILKEFTDDSDGVIKLANDGTDVNVMFISYPETSEGKMVQISKEQWKHFFEEEVEFLENGEKESEHANGKWKNVNGRTEIVIYKKDLELLPAVKEMPQEVQSAISEFRQLVKNKVSMEEKFQKLDDEKHFCFDENRFKEIVSEMDDLKKQAEALTKKAREVMAKIPQAQVAMIRKELDGASLE